LRHAAIEPRRARRAFRTIPRIALAHAIGLGNLVLVAVARGDFLAAEDHAREALTMVRRARGRLVVNRRVWIVAREGNRVVSIPGRMPAPDDEPHIPRVPCLRH
jgi:hypothetical protein